MTEMGAPGGAEPSAAQVGLREITRTGEMAKFPWPEDVMIQGGKSGVVIVRGGDNYRTAFVEAFPPGTFLRGEGATVAEAEEQCWAKYQRHLKCDGGGQHGPYEPRHYENGAGFCVKCGAWFSGVCEPSLKVRIERLACDRVKERWGEDVVILRKWHGLVADEQARIAAVLDGLPVPEATTADPTPEELAEAAEPPDFSALGEVLKRLVPTTGFEDAANAASSAARHEDPEAASSGRGETA